MSKTRIFASNAHATLVAGCIALLCVVLPADSEPKTKKAKSTEPPADEDAAQCRVWKDVLTMDRPIKVTFMQGKRAALEVKLAAGPQFFEYQKIPPGSYTLEVAEDAEGSAKITSAAVSIDAEDFCTILVRDNRKGKVDLEVIDDSIFNSSPSGDLTVRTFANAVESLQIKIGEQVSLKLSGPLPFAHFRGLPLDTVQVSTGGTDSQGKQVSWTNEIDFRKTPKATLLIVPDTYGRIRPRVTTDGVSR